MAVVPKPCIAMTRAFPKHEIASAGLRNCIAEQDADVSVRVFKSLLHPKPPNHPSPQAGNCVAVFGKAAQVEQGVIRQIYSKIEFSTYLVV